MIKMRRYRLLTILILTGLIALASSPVFGATAEKPRMAGKSEVLNSGKYHPPIYEIIIGETPPVPGTKVLRLDLQRAVKITLSRNPDLKIAKTRIKAAKGRYKRVRSALGLKLNVSGSYTRIDPISVITLPASGGRRAQTIKLGSENNFAARAVLEKVITTFGKLEYTIAAAALQVGVFEGRYEATRQEIIFQTKKAYYNALRAQGMMGITQDKLKIVKQQLKITKDLFEAGVVPKFEVLKGRLAVSKTRQRLIEMKNNAQMAEIALLNVLGADLNTPVILQPVEMRSKVRVDDMQAQKIAIERRPEIKALMLSRKATKYLLKSAKLGQNPVLSFQSVAENKTVSGFSSFPNTFTQTLVLSIPLSDGGDTAGQIKQARADLKELEQNIAKTFLQFQLEVKQAVMKLKEVEARLSAARQDVETATEGYSIALVRYENGLSTSLELNDSLQSLQAARINYLVTKYEYNMAVTQLERATATTWKGVGIDAKR